MDRLKFDYHTGYRGSPPPRPARAPPPPPSAGPEAARLQALLDACEAAGVRLRRALDAASGRRPVTAAELHRGLRRCGGSFSDVTPPSSMSGAGGGAREGGVVDERGATRERVQAHDARWRLAVL